MSDHTIQGRIITVGVLNDVAVVERGGCVHAPNTCALSFVGHPSGYSGQALATSCTTKVIDRIVGGCVGLKNRYWRATGVARNFDCICNTADIRISGGGILAHSTGHSGEGSDSTRGDGVTSQNVGGETTAIRLSGRKDSVRVEAVCA